jgi:putative ABC transport system ATP-binding protein
VSATFPAGALVAVAGPSGSGKSSLLRLIAGMDRPTSGIVEISGLPVGGASSRRRRALRRRAVGYVFQRPSDNFLSHLTVREHLARVGHDGRAAEILDALGIAGRADHLPSALSGGEQQRAAFAQALVGGASIVVADEPTAELDTASGDAVLGSIRELCARGVTFVLATHDPAVMRRADVVVRLDHGEVVDARRRPPSAAVAAPIVGVDPDAPTILRVRDVAKTYGRGEEVVHAVDGVSFDVRRGELVGLIGRSGSGKTTLLNLVAGWEPPDGGAIERPGDHDPPAWRDIAVVPQKLGLLDELSVRENVAHPAKLSGNLDHHADRVDELLEELGLSQLAGRRPWEASVGEQQRAAIARALLLRPRVLVTDEPTGHQDAGWTDRVVAAIRRACDEGTACLMATHDEAAARFFDRSIRIRDGRVDGSAG